MANVNQSLIPTYQKECWLKVTAEHEKRPPWALQMVNTEGCYNQKMLHCSKNIKFNVLESDKGWKMPRSQRGRSGWVGWDSFESHGWPVVFSRWRPKLARWRKKRKLCAAIGCGYLATKTPSKYKAILNLSYQHLLLHLQLVPSVPGSFYSTLWLLTPVEVLSFDKIEHLVMYSTLCDSVLTCSAFIHLPGDLLILLGVTGTMGGVQMWRMRAENREKLFIYPPRWEGVPRLRFLLHHAVFVC